MPTKSDVPEWKDFNENHPECEEGFFHLGNYRKKDIEKLSYKDMYVGKDAYSASGMKVNEPDGAYPFLLPVFVNRAEWTKDLQKKMDLKYLC